jgi:uncharacterized membrane protein
MASPPLNERPSRPAASAGAADLVEVLVARLLRWGVSLSMAIVALGLLVMCCRRPEDAGSPAAFARLTGPHAAFPHDLAAVARGLADLRGQSIIALGLALLILTPVARVAASVVGFALERDRAFALITGTVLAILIASLLLGSSL